MGSLLSIVISNDFMRIAELSVGRRGTVISRLLTKEIPGRMVEDGTIRNVKEFADYLASVLRSANIKTRRVIFSLPSDKILTREVLLPELSEEKLTATIKANASEYFPIDLSEYILSYFTLSKVIDESTEDLGQEDDSKKKKQKKSKKGSVQLRLMVVAAPNNIVQSYFDVARLAKLKLESVDYVGNSVFQLTSNQIGEEACLVIQLDRESTVLTIYYETIMTLQRHVDFGSSVIAQAVAEVKHLEYEEAVRLLEVEELLHDNFEDGDMVTDSLYYLIGNIKRVIEYYTGRNPENPLEQVYVVGDGSMMPGLERLLDNQLHLPVEMVTALKQVIIKENSDIGGRELLKYLANIGAALNPVGFVPKKLEQDLRRKLEAKIYRIMILLALFVALVVMTIPALKFFNTAMDTMDLQNRLSGMEDARPILDNYRQAQSRYEDVKNVQAAVKTNNQSLKKFIDVFEQLRPSNVSITNFSSSDGEVSFSALAAGKKTVAKLIQQLNTIANVTEVKVSNLSSSFEGEQETVSFSVTCKIAEDAAVLGEGITEDDMPSRQETYKYLNDAVTQIYGEEAVTVDAEELARQDDATEEYAADPADRESEEAAQ